MVEYRCRVEEVRSGDDLIVLVALGFDDLYKWTRVRLRGVDTPDAFKEAPESEAGRIRDEVRELTRGVCKIVVHSQAKSGWIVDLYVLTSTSEPLHMNKLLIDRGFVFKKEIAHE